MYAVKRSALDPRTKLFMIFAVSFVTMAGATNDASWTLRLVISAVPLTLLLLEGRSRAALGFAAFYASAYLLMRFFVKDAKGVLGVLLLGYCSIILQFFPMMVTAWYAVRTTRIDEFMAGMNRMHVPKGMTISLAVMLRFFPTIREEYAAIQDAMKMRGIRFGGGQAGKMLEYRFIPLLFSCVTIGDELSAAAVTRGLSSPVRRTDVCRIGFRRRELLLGVLFGALVVSYYIVRKEGG